jgi:hypothetical protein
MGQKFIISEEEKNQIKGLYELLEGKPATGAGNNYPVTNRHLANFLNNTFGSKVLQGTFSSNGYNFNFSDGKKTVPYSGKIDNRIQLPTSKIQNTGTWSRIAYSDRVDFQIK